VVVVVVTVFEIPSAPLMSLSASFEPSVTVVVMVLVKVPREFVPESTAVLVSVDVALSLIVPVARLSIVTTVETSLPESLPVCARPALFFASHLRPQRYRALPMIAQQPFEFRRLTVTACR